jgi:hypothetical protein
LNVSPVLRTYLSEKENVCSPNTSCGRISSTGCSEKSFKYFDGTKFAESISDEINITMRIDSNLSTLATFFEFLSMIAIEPPQNIPQRYFKKTYTVV